MSNPPGAGDIAAIAEQWKLTPKQRQILSFVIRGMTNKEIAAEAHCAEGTVELHLASLLRKTKAENRATLVAKFWGGV
jgi:two-component system, NarL family, nitrate/nitrite response regulator NarL